MGSPAALRPRVKEGTHYFLVRDARRAVHGGAIVRVRRGERRTVLSGEIETFGRKRFFHFEFRNQKLKRGYVRTVHVRNRVAPSEAAWLISRGGGYELVRKKLKKVWSQVLEGKNVFPSFGEAPFLMESSVFLVVPVRWNILDLNRFVEGVGTAKRLSGESWKIRYLPRHPHAKMSLNELKCSGLGKVPCVIRNLETGETVAPAAPFQFSKGEQGRWVEPPISRRSKQVSISAGRESSFKFTSEDGTVLHGSVEGPRRGRPKALVILIHGSGPETRDSGIGYEGRDLYAQPYLPFRDLSRRWVRMGLAVLRYDKRGVGQSGGHWGSVSHTRLQQDVLAAFRWATRRWPDLAIFLAGFSEGGVIALRAAATQANLAGIVLAGTPARSLQKVIENKMSVRFRILGYRKSEISRAVRDVRANLQALRIGKGEGSEYMGQPNSWWRDRLRQEEPRKWISKVRVPALVLHGASDLEVLVEEATHLARSLKMSKQNVRILKLAGLNHFFSKGFTRLPGFEYDVPSPVSDKFVKESANWIFDTLKRHVAR